MMRIGHSFDVHRLVPERALVLGGVRIDHELGLLGHSDADVLLHAVCDAIIGALRLGDIGRHFPDSDPAFKGIDSMLLLKHVIGLAEGRGYKVGNLDSTIIAQRPKLAPYIEQMRMSIAEALEISVDSISVKATTSEKMGFAGRQEGVAVHACALLIDY